MAKDSQIDPNAWMTTFGDLLMLLLTFFVLLLTMKSLDKEQLEKTFDYFQESHGPLEFAGGGRDPGEREGFRPVNITSMKMLRETINLMAGMKQHSLERNEMLQLKKIVDIAEDKRGVVISLESDHLFNTGEAEVRKEGLATINGIADLLRSAKNDVLIMGHTDNIPTRKGKYKSNWELSFYRSLSVLFYLTDSQGLKPQRLASGGYGGLMPRCPNNSKENRAKNRRVEFILRQSR